MVWPTVRRGFNDAYGFWNTYWISRRAWLERDRAASGRTSAPRRTLPV